MPTRKLSSLEATEFKLQSNDLTPGQEAYARWVRTNGNNEEMQKILPELETIVDLMGQCSTI